MVADGPVGRIGVPQGWVGVMGWVRRLFFFCLSVANLPWDSALMDKGCCFDTSVSAFRVGVGLGNPDVESSTWSHAHAPG